LPTREFQNHDAYRKSPILAGRDRNNERDFTMTKTRICEHDSAQTKIENHPVSPRLLRAIARNLTTVSDCTPVDTYNSNTINVFEVPEAPSGGRDKSASFKTVTKGRSVNLLFRASFLALAELHLQMGESQLSFVTVNLSQCDSFRIVSEGGAPAYAKKLRRRIQQKLTTGKQRLLQKPNFFLALEDSADGSKHVHIIMRHHPDDQPLLNSILRKEAADHDNAVQFKAEYRLWLDAEPGSAAWQANELDWLHDRGHGADYCVYRRMGINRGKVDFYRLMPVDAGAADYISKELERALKGNPDASRLYIDTELRSRAKMILEGRYKLKRDMKQMMPEYEKAYAQSLVLMHV